MLWISAVYAVMRCPSVCPSVTFVISVKMNKHIFKLFSPSGSQTIRVFKHRTLWRPRYADRDPQGRRIQVG